MTIPKKAGSSHLADVSNEQAPTFHYPVKKKGEPRRLRPNLDAIHWLEDESETDTEISEEYDAGEYSAQSPTGCEFKVQRANGWYDAERASMYPRPMFQTFDLEISSSSMVPYLKPCPACDDWSRTSRCSEHHDEDGVAGLRMGADRRAERNTRRNGPPTAYSDAPTDGGPRGIYDTLVQMYERIAAVNEQQIDERDRQERNAANLADQMMRRSGCTCSMCNPRPRAVRFYDPQADPNAGRPGYHYNFARDRWVPDADDSVLEIISDTTQASASTVRIEVERNDDTPT